MTSLYDLDLPLSRTFSLCLPVEPVCVGSINTIHSLEYLQSRVGVCGLVTGPVLWRRVSNSDHDASFILWLEGLFSHIHIFCPCQAGQMCIKYGFILAGASFRPPRSTLTRFEICEVAATITEGPDSPNTGGALKRRRNRRVEGARYFVSLRDAC